MKKTKKIELNKKTIKKLKLKLQPKSDRKVAPATVGDVDLIPTNGSCDLSHPWYTC